VVRPIEPDPPQVLPKSPERVRGTTATPEQLGQTSVREQGERSGRRKERPKGQPLDADSVTLQQATLETATEEQQALESTAGTEPVPPALNKNLERPHDHLDVKG
jgi:hypothetical protein